MRMLWAGAVGIVAVGFLAGCSSSNEPSGQVPVEEATAVVGTCECSITERTFDESLVIERFECTGEMSDARVTGTETFTAVSRDAGESGMVWTVDDAVLTTDDGIWRGTGHGIVDLVGVLPTAEGDWPYNYGEMHYIGEGAYDGWEFHNYISASNSEGGYAGWIAPTE